MPDLLNLGPEFGNMVIDRAELLRELDRADYEESLYAFTKAAWKYIDGAPWVDGWCIQAICEHLEAVADGEIRRLMINVPPRCSKSTVCSVVFPAWTWAQRDHSATSGPAVPFLHVSYGIKLALRDSVRCRRLIQSPWYQRLWGERFELTGDQNAKTRFGNNKNGERLITSITAGTTGEGGAVIVLDDANEAGEAGSEAAITTTNDYWDQTLSTRHNDAKTGAFVAVQQRLSENDLSGHILEQEAEEWTHLVLPMRYEADRSFYTPIGWKDPRTKEGELLWPERFGEAEVARLERALGPWGASGQLQQRPEPKGGGVIKREWWLGWPNTACGSCSVPNGQPACQACVTPRGDFPPFDFILASADTAFTEKTENDYSALTVWGVFTSDVVAQASRVLDMNGRPVDTGRTYSEPAPKVMMMMAWQERLPLHELVTKIAKTCKTLKVDLLVIENKASGISVAQEMRRLYSDEAFGVQLHDPKSQDKLARLYSVQHLFAEGMVYAPDRSWADMVITQVGTFPHSRHDDLTDTVSQALRKLRDMGLLVRAPERLAEIEEAKAYVGRATAALYPG